MGSRLRRAVSLGSLNQDLIGMALSRLSEKMHIRKDSRETGYFFLFFGSRDH